jgi:hypothetical protein
MLRTFIPTLAFALFLVGCGSTNNNGSGGNGGSGGTGGTGGTGTDMTAANGDGADLAMTLPPDMQPAYGCHALAGCIDACTDQASCSLCIQSSTQHAGMLYQTLTRCVRRECFPHPDGGPAPCTNGGGTPSAECTACQSDSIKMSGTCGADTTYCGTCYTQYSACQADTP